MSIDESYILYSFSSSPPLSISHLFDMDNHLDSNLRYFHYKPLHEEEHQKCEAETSMFWHYLTITTQQLLPSHRKLLPEDRHPHPLSTPPEKQRKFLHL
jgi:hypothetical protein